MTDEGFFLVVGMHRSGTSMVSGMVGLSGIISIGEGMGVRKVPHTRPMRENGRVKESDFEDSRTWIINDKILGALGGRWNMVPDYENIRNLKDGKIYALAERYLQTIHAEADGAKFCLKDPRFGITAPWWIENFPKIFRPKIIWAFRDMEEVVNSLAMRDSWAKQNPGYARVVSCKYVEYIKRMLSEYSLEYIKVEYADVLRDPLRAHRKICAFTGANPDRFQSEVMDWVRPRYKRN